MIKDAIPRKEEEMNIPGTNEEGSEKGSMSQAFMLGSLSSSCCFIQLILNALSYLGVMNGIGCAGFNTILGPLRPLMRFMTLCWLVWNWFSVSADNSKCCSSNNTSTGITSRKMRPRRPLVETSLCLLLMFSPEMVTFYGNFANGHLPPSYMIMHRQNLDSVDHFFRVRYVVDNMGCEACINAVERVIRGQDGVVKSSVTSFQTGEVEIYLESNEGAPWDDEKKIIFEEGLDKALKTYGYELHEIGWVTKKMKMNMQTKDKIFSSGDL